MSKELDELKQRFTDSDSKDLEIVIRDELKY